jgi:hypothetical protein
MLLPPVHNLSLIYGDCKLPIAGVSHYKKPSEIGETLSAANLAYMYLDRGRRPQAHACSEKDGLQLARFVDCGMCVRTQGQDALVRRARRSSSVIPNVHGSIASQ